MKTHLNSVWSLIYIDRDDQMLTFILPVKLKIKESLKVNYMKD